jgi:hypothetical protein
MASNPFSDRLVRAWIAGPSPCRPRPALLPNADLLHKWPGCCTNPAKPFIAVARPGGAAAQLNSVRCTFHPFGDRSHGKACLAA